MEEQLRKVLDCISRKVQTSKMDLGYDLVLERRGWWQTFPNDGLTSNFLLEVDKQLGKSGSLIEQAGLFSFEKPEDWLWLTEISDVEIAPIYQDAVILAERKLILKPSLIPNLVLFLGVPGTKVAVDIENHQFGYHFHYGPVRKSLVQRTNLVLTFDPAANEGQFGFPPLWAEKHGSGTPIDVETIGSNKRGPIYSVCRGEMQKKGLGNFKRPAEKSKQFYP